MFKIQNTEMARMFNLPVGLVLSKKQEAVIRPTWHAYLTAKDDQRFNQALATADKFARIVTKTWSNGGKTLRRGEVVYINPKADGLNHAMVTRSKSRTGVGFIWTCGMDEVRAHSKLVAQARREETTRQHAAEKIQNKETLTGEEIRVLDERFNRLAHEKYNNFSEEQKDLCKAHMRAGFSFVSAVEAATNGWEVR